MMKSSFEIAPPTDDHDEYWDDEDNDDDEEESESDHEDPVSNGLGNGSSNGRGGGRQQRQQRQKQHGKNIHRKKMKKMKVATQRDYQFDVTGLKSYLRSPQARGACCMGSIAIIIILIAVHIVIPKGRSGAASSEPEIMCDVHSTREPFSEWMHHIRKANSTELCRSEVCTFIIFILL